MNPTAISAVVPRRRTTVVGLVMSVSPLVRPWARVDVVVGDGSGELTLRFMGRAAIPGMTEGRRLRVEGTAAMVRGTLVMLNPLYEFIPEPCGLR